MADIKSKLETTQHIVLKVLMNDFEAYQVAKEIYDDRIRLDVKCDRDLTKINTADFEQKINSIIARNMDVSESVYDIADVPEGVDLSLLPEGVKNVRVISIGDFDSQPCDDPHVANTSEIGTYELAELKKIGKDTYRFINTVVDSASGKGQEKIKPRTLKGFRDFLPDELRYRRAIIKVFEDTFEKYGYEPLETPTLEYFDILMDKYGEEEKLVYNFEDFGGRKVALKYDLTVPTARVLAQYKNEIKLPWKRYQIQPVFRADNTQKGRYREFFQCDADCLGTESKVIEAEFITMAIEIIEKLGFKDFIVRMNNRKILNGIAKYAGAEDKFYDIVYAIDKWDKRTPAETKEDLEMRGLSEEQVDKIFNCINLMGSTSLEKLDNLEKLLQGINEGMEGIAEMKEIIELVDNEDRLKYDPVIARGLAYYTGPIWEILVIEGGVGSVAGCGRYDKLVGSYLGEDIPAAGGSFGLERLIDVMKEREMTIEGEQKERVMVANMPGYTKEAMDLSQKLRDEGMQVSLYPDSARKLGKQIEYADKKGFSKVYILGKNEIAKGGEPSVKEL